MRGDLRDLKAVAPDKLTRPSHMDAKPGFLDPNHNLRWTELADTTGLISLST
jgi:hypothetical protein